MVNGANSDATTRPDKRTGAWFLDTGVVVNSTSIPTGYRGKVTGRCFMSTQTSFVASLTVAFAKRHTVSTEEWVGFNSTTMNGEVLVKDCYLYGFAGEGIDSVPNSRCGSYDDTATGASGAWGMPADLGDAATGPKPQLIPLDTGASTSSDDVQPVLIDQPYPFDYTYSPTNQESPNFNRGFN